MTEPLCPRALITRPEPEASRWVQALASRGVPAHVLPLIAIQPVPDAAALIDTFARLGNYSALMFVSGNAARHFFMAFKRFAPKLLESGLLEMAAWSPGPGTSAVLRECGWPTALIVQPAADAPQFDSESLWQSVRENVRPGERVLIVRGGDAQGRSQGRDWLAEQSGWDRETTPPELPTEVVEATRARYVEAYERLTGRSFREIPAV